MSEDVDEIYDDGTSITNITVQGVKSIAAMFGPDKGPKPTVASKPGKVTPPALRKFREMQGKSGQGDVSDANSSQKVTGGIGRPFPATAPKPAPKSPPRVSIKPQSWMTSPGGSNFKEDHNHNRNDVQDTNKPKVTPGVSTKRNSRVNIPNIFQEGPQVKTSVPSSKPTESVSDGSLKPSSSEAQQKLGVLRSVSSSPTAENISDLKSKLKPVKSTVNSFRSGVNINIANSRQRVPDGDKSEISPPPGNESVATRTSDSPTKTDLARRNSRKSVVLRESDNKKFKLVNTGKLITSIKAPAKPPKLQDIEINQIIEEYKAAVVALGVEGELEEFYDDVGAMVEGDLEELYDDVDNIVPKRESVKSTSGRPVSVIPDMTEEEELGSQNNPSKPNGPNTATDVEQEMYDDCGAPLPEDDGEELYEPLDEEIFEGGSAGSVSDSDKKEKERKEKEALEKKKKEEKEKKEQERKEKAEKDKREKEEKERIKREEKEKKEREKEEKEIKKKFKLDGTETSMGDGVVQEKAKGGKTELAVQKGQIVAILRMTNNPKGKWLVKDDDGKIGYVDSDNIKVDTPAIRQAMNATDTYVNSDGPPNDDEGETYEAIEGYDEEIYEECS